MDIQPLWQLAEGHLGIRLMRNDPLASETLMPLAASALLPLPQSFHGDTDDSLARIIRRVCSFLSTLS